MPSLSSLHILLFFMLSSITFVFVIYIYSKWVSIHSKIKRNLPPSPPRLPVIGNFHQIGSSPNHSLRTLSQKYGPIMLLHFGSVPTLVASSADAAKEILKTHDLSFSSRPSLTIFNILVYGSTEIALSPYGEYWRQLKSVAVIHLLSNTRVKSFHQAREIEMHHLIDVLGESRGSSVDLGLLLLLLANNTTCRVALGRSYNAPKLIYLTLKFNHLFTVFSLGSYIPWLTWVDRLRGLEARAKRVAKEFDEFLEGVLEEHESKKRRTNREGGDGKDLIDILLDIQRDKTTSFTLSRDSLKGVILDLFMAGTETTATSLEWAISELIKHPTKMKKLQHEVTEIAHRRSMILEEDLEKMSYLKAVIKESLRLHPPIPLLLPHLSLQDVKVMGYDIQSGTQVIINAWAIGRDPSTWQEPDRFWPERFLNSTINYKAASFEWIPFGAGRRGCPGVQFAATVMELVLANIVYKFDLALPNGVRCEDLDMTETCGITLHRKNSLKVIPIPRF